MKRRISLLIFSLFSLIVLLSLSGCETPQSARNNPAEYNPATQELRHGFTIFTGPKRTLLGVNDVNSTERGHLLFQKHCASCHGVTGEGDGVEAKRLGIKPANLASIAKKLPNHYLVIQINQGRENMPIWEDMLTAEQVWDLSNYIQNLKPPTKAK
jgi:mono/diheme cytochrome c family protein